jgi:hypothetical protein
MSTVRQTSTRKQRQTFVAALRCSTALAMVLTALVSGALTRAANKPGVNELE